MKKCVTWFWLLNKRLYKKPSFLILLVCIPILALAFSAVANNQSGFVTVALAREDPSDALSAKLISDFMEEDSLIRFVAVSSPQDATLAVHQGQADAAWIFKEDMAQKLADYSQNPQSVVTVLEREQTVFTRISREKLSAVLFPYCAKGQYVAYLHTNFPKLQEVPQQELEKIYQTVSISQELFTFENGQGQQIPPQDTNYLTAPIRGLLAVFLTVTAMAATLFTLQDEQKGVYCYGKGTLKKWLPLWIVLIAALNSLAVVQITLFVCGLQISFLRELLVGMGYCLCSAVFCLFLKNILPTLKIYAAAMVPLTIAMIVLCPVFLDIKAFWWLQLLFPPTYYLNGITTSRYVWYMLAYTLILGVGSVGWQWIKNKKMPISY